MSNLQKKSKIATIGLILALTIAVTFLTCVPMVNAVDLPSYPFINVAPNPVGIGETLAVYIWLSAVTPTAAGASGDRWQGLTVTVTKPDATTQTLGPFTADPVASAYTYYTPDQLGTYYFQVNFPGQQITGTDARSGLPIDNYYKPSTSPKLPVTVQQDPIQAYPEWPLPDENTYWERPINYENRAWWSISGNWLQGWYNAMTGSFNPYTKAPNTPHIVWTKPVHFGGLIGGEFGSIDYYTGMSYEPTWSPPVIIQGRLYYNQRLGSSSWQGLACVDIRTGEQLWFKNGTTITLGQIYDYESPNQHGAIPYLWEASGTTWKMYDAFTGDWILNIANATAVGKFAASIVYSPAGDMISYFLGSNWLAMWNSSKISGWLQGSTGPDVWSWRPPQGKTLDWQTGIQWNVTVPGVPGQSIQKITPDVIIASVTTDTTLNKYTHMGYSTKTGELLWSKERTNLPVAFATTNLGGLFASGIGAVGDGVYAVFTMATMQWWGYDVYTGDQIWGPTEPYTNSWGMYAWGLGSPAIIAYGKLYAATFDGMVHCYNVKTGEHLWDYSTGSSGFETPYGTWPFSGGITVADGKIFAATSEHSPNVPLYRGEKLHVIDAETGKGVWTILGWYNGPGLGAGVSEGVAVADGYLLGVNSGDGQIYCFGKGKTAITVDAPITAITLGESLVLRGSVIDQSPGAEGTPAIADEYMTEWMQYLYMQKPCPAHVEGVEVVLETLDPNGNFYEIGTVTSDATGLFSLLWEPEVEGKYTIIATFEGSESYWSSYAETAIGVTKASSPGGPIEPEPTEAPLITTEMAIILAAVIVALAVILGFWIIRKRK